MNPINKTEKVNLSNLVDSIAEDEFFGDHLDDIVRETLDGDKETLE